MSDNRNQKILFFDPADAPKGQDLASPATAVRIDGSADDVLAALVRIIRECGQDPVTQLAGYLMTDDPTYLPDSAHARALADHIGRDKLMETLIESYLASGMYTGVNADTSEVSQ